MKLVDLLQMDGWDGYRLSLLEKVQQRFGKLPAEHLKQRLGRTKAAEVIAWERRVEYAVSYAQIFQPTALAVTIVSASEVLRHAFGSPIRCTAVLLRFRKSGFRNQDMSLLRERVPWLLDVPYSDLAFRLLRLRGWLLVTCAQAEQAAWLVRGTRQSSRLTIRQLVPGSSIRLPE